MGTEDTQPFTADEVARMVAHMNEDHADSVRAYACHFGGRADATAAELRDIGAVSMRLRAETAGGPVELEIPFDHRLESTHDAHMTMVGMSKRAKRALGWS